MMAFPDLPVLDDVPRERCRYVPDERRFVWDVSLDAESQARIDAERDTFDEVAELRRARLERERPGPWTSSPSLDVPELVPLLRDHPELLDVRGQTILDVGGTLPVAWRFITDGAEAVHQIDVSPESQRVGLARCALQLDAEQRERVWFHTVPAEELPFSDGPFDLVFSRHSVHHLERPRVFDAFARVLAPGGRLLIFEPWLNRPLRAATYATRRVRGALWGVDRGSDDPLGRADVAALKQRFSHVEVGRFGAGGTPLVWVFGRVRRLHPPLRAWLRAERVFGNRPRIARAIGVRSWILAIR
jgi:SAM-dependent methyltransferase